MVRQTATATIRVIIIWLVAGPARLFALRNMFHSIVTNFFRSVLPCPLPRNRKTSEFLRFLVSRQRRQQHNITYNNITYNNTKSSATHKTQSFIWFKTRWQSVFDLQTRKSTWQKFITKIERQIKNCCDSFYFLLKLNNTRNTRRKNRFYSVKKKLSSFHFDFVINFWLIFRNIFGFDFPSNERKYAS